jgi:tight adherence protein B
MDSNELIQYSGVLFMALAIAGIVFALAYPYLSGDKKGERRLQAVTDNKARRGGGRTPVVDNAAQRRKQVADTLKDLEERQKKTEKVTLRLRLQRAGLDVTPKAFWIASFISGAVTAIVVMLSVPGSNPIVLIGSAVVGTLGLPRWFLSLMIKRRQNKFLVEFANAIDVIVRGVKSGLPLNECLQIIARESPEPLCSEFREVVEQGRVGVPLGEALERMMTRVPLAEVKFFAIVIGIQQQAGGNLSEALGNLSGVLRDRKKMQMKIKALSAEAKASAGVLASLPFVVTTMLIVVAPKYIAFLWNTKMGHFLIGCAAVWMFMGIMVMRKMINFKF